MGNKAVPVSNGILIIGDPVVDRFAIHLPPAIADTNAAGAAEDWQRRDRAILGYRHGGIFLTRDVLRSLVKSDTSVGWVSLRRDDSEHVLHSMAELRVVDKGVPCRFGDAAGIGKQGVFKARIASLDGYHLDNLGPIEQPSRSLDSPCSVVVLNDARSRATRIAADMNVLSKAVGPHTVVLHKRHLPLGDGNALQAHLDEAVRPRMFAHVSADDLRREGVVLRSERSWRQALDDLEVASKQSILAELLGNYAGVIVQCGVEGAILLRSPAPGRTAVCDAVIDPVRAEGECEREPDGYGHGVMNAFLCVLAVHLHAAIISQGHARSFPDEAALKAALGAARSVAMGAFTVTLEADGVKIDPPDVPNNADEGEKYFARIGEPHSDLPLQVVQDGTDALKIPHARFGKLVTAEESEMIAYRALARLMTDYVTGKSDRPLSVGVFGRPGSGKSFGIEEIASGLGVDVHTYNLSEIEADDLPGFFHELRDVTLRGRLPLCFLDEFDSNGGALISRFLAPMQDGKFRDGARTHPLGRAILVFAGGTASTLDEFRSGRPLETGTDSEAARMARAKALKIPDFVSRLRAKIEIVGLGDPGSGTDDPGRALRRAILLRSMIERHARRAVIEPDGRARMPDALIRAFLDEAVFHNDARSMEQIVLSSALTATGGGFGAPDLPPRHLLEMHLKNAQEFLAAATEAGAR